MILWFLFPKEVIPSKNNNDKKNLCQNLGHPLSTGDNDPGNQQEQEALTNADNWAEKQRKCHCYFQMAIGEGACVAVGGEQTLRSCSPVSVSLGVCWNPSRSPYGIPDNHFEGSNPTVSQREPGQWKLILPGPGSG